MDNLEMLIGYDINLFEKKFENNEKKLSFYMHKCFKETIGDKVAGIVIEENLLYAWGYYFVLMADENPSTGDSIMKAMIGHFYKLIEDKDKIEIKGDISNPLMLSPTFCRIWFGTSLYSMLYNKLGEEKFEKAFAYIEENYLKKECKTRSMMLQENKEK